MLKFSLQHCSVWGMHYYSVAVTYLRHTVLFYFFNLAMGIIYFCEEINIS